MEVEFDKEIDALMRKGGLAVGGSPADGHLDADEIAAFAENAMPERARALYLGHFADCDRCRRILSNLIVLNAEAEPEKAAAALPLSVPAATETPWYRKLFLFPNLAYVMGGLVLVMGGLIGLSVFQGSLGGGSATVSQVSEGESMRGPMAPTEPGFAASANTASNLANTMSNTAVSAANSNAPAETQQQNAANAASIPAGNAARPADKAATAAPAPGDADVAMTDAPAAKPMQAAPPAPPPAMMEAAPKDAAMAKEDDARARESAQENEKKKISARSAKREEMSIDGQRAPRTQAGGLAKATPGPTRDMQQNFPNRADNTYEMNSRRVGGKDFQFRNGAWYDTAYKGQQTTKVRRGTDEYRKLDSGIRSIAESLTGVVVVVSGNKAYRIE